MTLFWRDFYIATISDESRFAWRWEIKRRSMPMGVKLVGDGYPSQRAAEEAGRHALANFLSALTSEVRRG
jgi:hypothetical protein